MKRYICAILVLVAAYYYYTNYDHLPTGRELYNVEELKLFDGVHTPFLYLSILGLIYNVTDGFKHYGPGKTYNFFAAKDASRSFVTGDYKSEKNTDLVDDFDHKQMQSLKHWVDFYKKHYKFVGKLVGTYYNNVGELTDYGKKIDKMFHDAEVDEEMRELEKLKYPPCNVEWSQELGTRVWCTVKSGGVQRQWAGYPRELFSITTGETRCACIQDPNLKNAEVRSYPNCDKVTVECYVKIEEQ